MKSSDGRDKKNFPVPFDAAEINRIRHREKIMTIGNALYTLIIGPLELLFETVFSLSFRFVNNPGISILFLSLVVNLLVLPLYRRADAMQAEERDKEEKLKYWVARIKNTFQGDEQFMMLQTYYRQNDYKPLDVLKGSVSLLLQIPFFIAAYRFLSGLQTLKGVPFGPIHDLGAPDGMLTLFGLSVNVLPILMTLVNFVSASIYLKGFPIKNKLQMYGMAAVFLVILYNSPSGLVLYWTCNNIFSLLKNILGRMKNPGKVLKTAAFFLGFFVQEYLLFRQPFRSFRKTAVVGVLSLLLQLPMLSRLFIKNGVRLPVPEAGKNDDRLFAFGSVFMTLLTGVLISSEVIKTSPPDFIYEEMYYSPLWYILSSLLLAAGTFMLWCGIFYKLASSGGKKIMAFLMLSVSICSAVNYMFFGTNRGDISANLVFDNIPADSLRICAVNLGVLLLVCLFLLFVWKKKEALAAGALLTLSLAVLVMSARNVWEINRDLNVIKNTVVDKENPLPEITLSKTGKNVVIFMVDRAIGYYFPFLMEEKPVLKEQFAGFTYYPQTISYANKTNMALPAIYGGYEYTPEKINERTELSLMEKHNEALLLLPALFDGAGYQVNILQPTYANYKIPSDLSLYEKYPNVKASNIKDFEILAPEVVESEIRTRNRNFFCYSIYKIVPLIFQPTIYTDGMYNEVDAMTNKKVISVPTQRVHNLFQASGIRMPFQRNLNVLEKLPVMTVITDDDVNTFTALDNGTTHEQVLLQLPDYVISDSVDNTPFESRPVLRSSGDGREIEITTTYQMVHYHCNMAAFLALGKWMDYLRENEVFDNTRIIIVSDHGEYQHYEGMLFGPGESWLEDVLYFNPVLLVKDFDQDMFTVDSQLMTNADVPTLAMDGLIGSPVNPATGNPVTDEDKQIPDKKCYFVGEYNIKYNNGNTFIPFYTAVFHGGDIYDGNNWEFIEDY